MERDKEKTQQGQQMPQQGSQQNQQNQGIGSPISNEAYDVLSALHSKLEGLEAYRKYSRDVPGGDGGRLWKQLSDMDNQCVQLLVEELERLVKDGRFRMIAPGTGARPKS
jgi:hypothetical protein